MPSNMIVLTSSLSLKLPTAKVLTLVVSSVIECDHDHFMVCITLGSNFFHCLWECMYLIPISYLSAVLMAGGLLLCFIVYHFLWVEVSRRPSFKIQNSLNCSARNICLLLSKSLVNCCSFVSFSIAQACCMESWLDLYWGCWGSEQSPEWSTHKVPMDFLFQDLKVQMRTLATLKDQRLLQVVLGTMFGRMMLANEEITSLMEWIWYSLLIEKTSLV